MNLKQNQKKENVMGTTIEEKIAVMQAYAKGKKIEIYSERLKIWKDIKDPHWDWINSNYRIKEESNYRPYTFKELTNAITEKGGYVISKQSGIISNIKHLYPIGTPICMGDCRCGFETLLDNYIWLDESPCGIKI